MSFIALLVLVLVGCLVGGVAIAAVLGSQSQLRWQSKIENRLDALREELQDTRERMHRLEEDRDFYRQLVEPAKRRALGEGEDESTRS